MSGREFPPGPQRVYAEPVDLRLRAVGVSCYCCCSSSAGGFGQVTCSHLQVLPLHTHTQQVIWALAGVGLYVRAATPENRLAITAIPGAMRESLMDMRLSH